MDQLLDEDGRCRRTELLPSECGCTAHRGGRCALTPSHRIQAGSEIGMAVQEDDICSEEEGLWSEVGWVCEQCVRTITA
jgi:hypothetical protein